MAIKFLILKFLVVWRRFRRGSNHFHSHHLRYGSQVASLMARANPFSTWNERANWMIDVADWVRRHPKVSLLDESAWRRVKQQRIRLLMEWLSEHRQVRRVVQTTIHKTLREALGPELFCATGLPREHGFFGELWEHVLRKILPRPPANRDLSVLFTSMFPDPADADWLRSLDEETLVQLRKLCVDDEITHGFQRQIDEALMYLVTMVVGTGVSPEFRRRLDPQMPLQVTPFMALRRELENYLLAKGADDSALRSVRMLIAVCQAQTDRVYAHLDRHGVSVGLVFRTERMRAQLTRMTRLIDLRADARSSTAGTTVPVLLADLIVANHRRSSLRGLVGRSVSLLARKIVERKADHGEQYLARDRTEYRVMLKAASIGGVVLAFIMLGNLALHDAGLARFFEGTFASANYALGFLAIAALGGVLAGSQPVATAPALGAKMVVLDTTEGMHSLMREIVLLLRSQVAAVFGNLIAVVPVMLMISLAVGIVWGASVMPSNNAHLAVHRMSIAGATPLLAALTGVLLWLASLSAGFADNWFALRRLREALTHHRRLIYVLGAARAERCARWLERHIAGIVGNMALAVLMGMTPVLAQFFGLALEVRHVTLEAATLTVAASSLGWQVLASSEFWLALAGAAVIALLNVGVAFGCALSLAMQARDVPARLRHAVWRTIVKKLATSPRNYLYPAAVDAAEAQENVDTVDATAAERRRSARKAANGRR